MKKDNKENLTGVKVLLADSLPLKIEQVEKEIEGLWELTCGVNKFDYCLGAREAIERLKDIVGINRY